MDLINLFNSYFNLLTGVIAIISIIISFIFFVSWRAKKHGSNLKNYFKEIYKNLPNRYIDDFNFTSNLELRREYPILNSIAKTRVLHSSAINNFAHESIHVHSESNKIYLNYRHIRHNDDKWLSYVIKNFDEDAIKDYYEKGYYLCFTACSEGLNILVIETKSDKEVKKEILLNSYQTNYYCKLKVIINNIRKFREICFVVSPFTENELEGTVEISNLKLVKNIKKCPNCDNKYSNKKENEKKCDTCKIKLNRID